MIDEELESELSKYFERVASQSPRLGTIPTKAGEPTRSRAMPLVATAAAVLVVLGISIGAGQLLGVDKSEGPIGNGQGSLTSDDPDATKASTSDGSSTTTHDLLEGRWEPMNLGGSPVTKQSAWEADPWIDFAGGGTFEAWDGCNRIAGRYSLSQPDSLRFTSWAGKAKGCANFPHPLDAARIGRVSDNSELTLLDHAGDRLATYRRAE